MDTRDTPEQAELRRSARQLAGQLAPATVADLDDATRAKRLAGAVRDAGWLELRSDGGDGRPLAGGVEAAIVADALGGAVADVAFSGPVLAADLARRAGTSGVEGATVAWSPALTDAAVVPGATTTTPVYAVDPPAEHDAAYVLVPDGVQLTRLNVIANLSNQLDLSVATLGVSLLRMPLRLTNPPPQPTVLAQIFSSDDGHQVLHGDITQQSLGAVDLSTFRYLISFDWSGFVLVSHVVTIVSVQIEYTT